MYMEHSGIWILHEKENFPSPNPIKYHPKRRKKMKAQIQPTTPTKTHNFSQAYRYNTTNPHSDYNNYI